MSVSDRRVEKILYIFPVTFSLLAVLHPNFIIYSTCNPLHVTSINILFDQYKYLTVIYSAYYFIFPAVALYFFAREYKGGFSKRIKFGVTWSLMFVAILFAQLSVIFGGVVGLGMKNLWVIANITLVIVGLIFLVLVTSLFYKKHLFVYLGLLIFASVGISVPVLYIFFPIIGYDFPSIFCQFAFLYSIAILIFVDVFQSDFRVRKMKSN